MRTVAGTDSGHREALVAPDTRAGVPVGGDRACGLRERLALDPQDRPFDRPLRDPRAGVGSDGAARSAHEAPATVEVRTGCGSTRESRALLGRRSRDVLGPRPLDSLRRGGGRVALGALDARTQDDRQRERKHRRQGNRDLGAARKAPPKPQRELAEIRQRLVNRLAQRPLELAPPAVVVPAPGDVKRPQPAPVVLGGLLVAEPPRDGASGGEGVVGGLRGLTVCGGFSEVIRQGLDVGPRVADRLERLADTAVQARAPGEAQPAVDRVADERVRERVVAVALFGEQPRGGRLVKGVEKVRLIADGALDHRDRERLSCDGRHVEDLSGRS